MKRILIYCRESRDDNMQNYDRIETQAKMLTDFVEKEKLGTIVDIVLDDNKTGTNFKRLEPIKEMILDKKFDIFLCKDCSRIGRNLLESLKFIEFLDYHNIELLFLTETYDEDIFPIKAWFNQLRVKDDSKKIKDVLNKKMRDGTLLISAPFGYDKVENKLIINIETSKTVKLIFDLSIMGYDKNQIASYLNINSIKTPSMYKPQYKNKSLIWNSNQVHKILTNQIYTGKMIYNTKKSIGISKKKYISNDKSNWLIIDKHHDKIITDIEFNKVNYNTNFNKRNTRNHTSNIFNDILICGDCSEKMYRQTTSNKAYYICKNYNTYGNAKCTSKKIFENELIEYVKNHLLGFTIKSKFIIDDNSELKAEILNLEKQINDYKNRISILYEDKLNNIIPLFLYTEKMTDYQNKLTIAEKNILIKKQQLKSAYDEEKLKDLINNYKLTNHDIKQLFDKIVISDFDIKEVLFN